MTDIVFLDTETLGLNPDAPIWEFAAIRCTPGRPVQTRQFFIEHASPERWLPDMPKAFVDDYGNRYDEAAAYTQATAASEIHFITNGAIVVGAVPSFDTERLAKLLRRNGIEPAWHYQPCDVETLVAGHLARQGDVRQPPWDSNALSAAVGVDPDRFARHTAMGDVRWCQAQYHAVMGRPEVAHRDVVLVRLFLDDKPVANLGVEDWEDGEFTLPSSHPFSDWIRRHALEPGVSLIVESAEDPEWSIERVVLGYDTRIVTVPRRERVRRCLQPDAWIIAHQDVVFA